MLSCFLVLFGARTLHEGIASALPAPTVPLVSWVLVSDLPWLIVWPWASRPLLFVPLKSLAADRMSGGMQLGWLVRILTCSLLLFNYKSLCQTPAVLPSALDSLAGSKTHLLLGRSQCLPPTGQLSDPSLGCTALITAQTWVSAI